MKFYYTTTAGTEEEGYSRQEPERSLGGFRSGTPVPNGQLNSLFGDISKYTEEQVKDEYIALILKNETGGDITGINVYFTFPEGSYSKFEIAAVDLNVDSEGRNYMENVPNYNSAPYFATFVGADGVANKQNIGGLVDDAEVGIWIKRVINTDVIVTDRENFIYKENESDTQYVQKGLNTEDSIVINLEWT